MTWERSVRRNAVCNTEVCCDKRKGSSMPQTGPWTGDPVWLADVLRAEGVNPVEYAGWLTRGHGDFKDIR